MKFKYHRWFQALVVPLVALAFHIFFGYRVIGRENIPEGGCVVCPNHVQLSDPPFAAVKTRAPILPMYITEGKRFRCRATVVIGKPFTPDPKQKDYGLIADDILRRIYELKEQV